MDRVAMRCCEFCRRPIVQRAMRTQLVVIASPRSDDHARSVETFKPMVVQAFVPEATIEAFNERVLRRLAWCDEFQLHAIAIRPLIERPTGELRSLVGANGCG